MREKKLDFYQSLPSFTRQITIWCTVFALSFYLANNSSDFLARADSTSKYGPDVRLLSKFHDYITKNPAYDYWAISPYYIAQQTSRACSLASSTMLLNAFRINDENKKLATQTSVLLQVNEEEWTQAVSPNGRGVSLSKLKNYLEKALKTFEINNTWVEQVNTAEVSNETRIAFHSALLENEKSAKDFLIINFNLGTVIGDPSPDSQVGHFAPVGAYDAEKKLVLLMDPARGSYEPYWVPEEAVFQGMTMRTRGGNGYSRGYLWVKSLTSE